MVEACFNRAMDETNELELKLAGIRRIRLREWADKNCGGNVAELARRCGRSGSQIADMLVGRKMFGAKVARLIEAKLAIPNGWLDQEHPLPPELEQVFKILRDGGTGTLSISDATIGALTMDWVKLRDAQMRDPHEPGPDFVPVPRVLFKLSAGVTGFTIEHEEGNGKPIFFRVDYLKSRNLRADKLLAVRVNGVSMEPGLWDGDLVVVNLEDTTPRDGEVFAANYDGELVIKRMKRERGQWWLASDNADKTRFGDRLCDEQVILLGKIVYRQTERI